MADAADVALHHRFSGAQRRMATRKCSLETPKAKTSDAPIALPEQRFARHAAVAVHVGTTKRTWPRCFSRLFPSTARDAPRRQDFVW